MMMLTKFRQQYPQGSLIGELVKIDRGTYIVKVVVRVNDVILATALAGANTVEAAEDSARERAIASVLSNDSAVVNSTTSEGYIPANKQPEPSLDREPIVEPERESKDIKFYEDTAESDRSPLPASETAREPATTFVEPQLNLEIPQVDTPQPLFDETFEADFSPASDRDDPESVSPSEPSPPVKLEAMDFNEIKQKTDIEIKRLGWTKDDGREFLKSRYGKRSRLHLTDEQLLEFLEYLEKQPNPVS